jgi:nucleoside-diphosphate-sugar epimerase
MSSSPAQQGTRAPLWSASSSGEGTAWWYDRAKVAAEHLVALGARRGALGAGVSLRMALLLGAGPRRNDRQFLPAVVAHCARGGVFTFDDEEALEAHGSSAIGERDFGRGVVDALRVDRSDPYNLAGAFVTWRALVTTVARALGVRPRIALRPEGTAAGEMRLPRSRSALCTARLREATGFAGEEALDALVAAYVVAERGGVGAPG